MADARFVSRKQEGHRDTSIDDLPYDFRIQFNGIGSQPHEHAVD